MDVEHLVAMANQIGHFYESLADRDEALSSTATHMRRFWDPRMRRAMLGHIDEHGGTGLEPFTLEAIQRHRATWEPKVAQPRSPG
ncbi:MAG TPA: formate dehydrogenase subunit delta [Gemmatimonadaceae bacterium]|jgi:formate dehydrogenase subunit delta|nr:formate dehydrogenase subunit delta [Gemmatimonadaceae bacterium]